MNSNIKRDNNTDLAVATAFLDRLYAKYSRGYIFLCHIPQMEAVRAARMKTTKAANAHRQKHFHQTAYEWPKQRDEAFAYVVEHLEDELYYTPSLFGAPQRVAGTIKSARWAYADLDDADAREIEPALKPTMAYESSTGRWVGLWELGGNVPAVGQWGNVNHRLAQYLGADESGWDETQVLRLPGSRNNKPGKVKGDRARAPAWDTGKRYTARDFKKLPPVEGKPPAEVDAPELDEIPTVDIRNVLRDKRIGAKAKQMIRAKSLGDVLDSSGNEYASLSEGRQALFNLLAFAGLAPEEMIAIVRETIWISSAYNRLKVLTKEAAKAQESAETQEPKSLVSSWDSVDFSDVLSGKRVPPKPTIGAREDGQALFYPGRVSLIYASMNHGKTWLAMQTVAVELNRGKHVVYIDYESDDAEIVTRLMELGVSPKVLDERFHYKHPRCSAVEDKEKYEEVLDECARASVVFIDGLTEYMSLEGLDPNSAVDIARAWEILPSRIAERGPGVGIIDHSNKNAPETEPFPGGSGHKANAATGVCLRLYRVDDIEPGTVGSLRIWVAKDRGKYVKPASVRVHGFEMKLFGTLEVDMTDVDAAAGKYATATIIAHSGEMLAVVPAAGGPRDIDTDDGLRARIMNDAGPSGTVFQWSKVVENIQVRKSRILEARKYLLANQFIRPVKRGYYAVNHSYAQTTQ